MLPPDLNNSLPPGSGPRIKDPVDVRIIRVEFVVPNPSELSDIGYMNDVGAPPELAKEIN
jgi:hypothetical protein